MYCVVSLLAGLWARVDVKCSPSLWPTTPKLAHPQSGIFLDATFIVGPPCPPPGSRQGKARTHGAADLHPGIHPYCFFLWRIFFFLSPVNTEYHRPFCCTGGLSPTPREPSPLIRIGHRGTSGQLPSNEAPMVFFRLLVTIPCSQAEESGFYEIPTLFVRIQTYKLMAAINHRLQSTLPLGPFFSIHNHTRFLESSILADVGCCGRSFQGQGSQVL